MIVATKRTNYNANERKEYMYEAYNAKIRSEP